MMRMTKAAVDSMSQLNYFERVCELCSDGVNGFYLKLGVDGLIFPLLKDSQRKRMV